MMRVWLRRRRFVGRAQIDVMIFGSMLKGSMIPATSEPDLQ